MKKLISTLLTLTMLMGVMGTAVFALQPSTPTPTQVGSITLSNVVLAQPTDDNVLTVYFCEDLAVVTINEDIYWMNPHLITDEYDIPLDFDETYSDESLPMFDIDNMTVLVDETQKTYTMAEYFAVVDAGELSWAAPARIVAGSSFVILVPAAIFSLETISLDRTKSETCYVHTYDYDGIPTVLDDTTTPVAPTPATAAPTASTILVDGETVAFDAYNIADNNYFKLRDIASILDGTDASFEVTWNQDAEAIEMFSGQSYTAVGGEMTQGDGSEKAYEPSTATIYLDGQEITLTAYTIGDNNYFKLRDLGEAIGFNVSWDNDAQTIVIASDEAYTAD